MTKSPSGTGAVRKLDVVAAASAPEDAGRHAAADRERAALTLERRRRESFVATLAHEIRQPLAALLAAVEVIRLSPDAKATSRATDIMKRQIAQMNRVVEDLLDASRWAQGKMTLRKRRLDLRDVIAEAASDVRAAVAALGQELAIAPIPHSLWVDVDPQRIHQVLANLLRNAIKYTPAGGRISLSAESGLRSVTFSVRDTGHGIEPAALPHIFDLFNQVQPADDGGLGIGLSVVREIVTLHGGRIEARSAGSGHGSEFIVTLPAAADLASVQDSV